MEKNIVEGVYFEPRGFSPEISLFLRLAASPSGGVGLAFFAGQYVTIQSASESLRSPCHTGFPAAPRDELSEISGPGTARCQRRRSSRRHRDCIGLVAGILPSLGHQGVQLILARTPMLPQAGVGVRRSARNRVMKPTVSQSASPSVQRTTSESAGEANAAVQSRLRPGVEIHHRHQAQGVGQTSRCMPQIVESG